MKILGKKLGFLFVTLLLMMSLATTAYAVVNEPIDFYEAIFRENGEIVYTNTPVADVSAIGYKCNTINCQTLGSQFLNEINSGNSNRLTVTYPTTAQYPAGGAYGIYAYNPDYITWEITSTYAGNGNAPLSRGYLAQIETCRVGIDKFEVINDVHPNQPIMVDISASLDSTVTSPIVNAGFLEAIPSSLRRNYQVGVDVVLEIKDRNGNVVNTQTKPILVDFSGSEDVEFTYTPTNTGRYTAVVSTYATDGKCKSTKPHNSIQGFDVITEGETELCYILLDNLDASAQNVFVGETVDFTLDKFANAYDEFGELFSIDSQITFKAFDEAGVEVHSESRFVPKSSITQAEKLSFQYVPASSGDHTVQVTAEALSCPYPDSISDEVGVSVFTTYQPIPNNAPVIANLPDQTLYENSVFNTNLFDVADFASDVDGDDLSFTITHETNTAVVNCGLGASTQMTCLVLNNKLGCSDVTVQVSDGKLIDSDTFRVCVVEDPNKNVAPVLTNLPDQTLYKNSAFNNNLFNVADFASDANGDALTYHITTETNTAVVNCALNPSPHFSCLVFQNKLGCSDVTVVVSDGKLTAEDVVRVCVVEDPNANVAPVLTNLPDQTLYKNSAFNNNLFNVADFASDANGDALTYHITTETNTAVVNCALNPSPNFSCLVFQDKLGCSDVTVVVSDGKLTAEDVVRVCVVEDPNANVAPVLANLPDQTLYKNSAFNTNLFNVADFASDANGDALTYNITTETNTAVVNCALNPSPHFSCLVFQNKLGCSDVTVVVSDGKLTAEDVVRVCVVEDPNANVAPIMGQAPDQTIFDGSGVNYNLFDFTTISSDANGDTLRYGVLSQSRADIVECFVTPTSGILECASYNSGVLGCSEVVVFASDEKLYDTTTFNVCVIADPSRNEAPVANFPDVVMQQNDPATVVATLSHYVSDADGDQLSISFVSQSNTAIVQCSLAANTEVTCQPELNNYGESTLTFSVSDGKKTIYESFVVSVERDLTRYTATSPDDVDPLHDSLFLNQFKVLNDDCYDVRGYCDEIIVYFDLRNDGDIDYEDVRVSFTSFDLGVKRTVGPFDLDQGDIQTGEVYMQTFGEIEPGYHTIRLTITSREGIERIVHRDLFIRG